jgi:lactoylglutathione lyase
MSRKIADLINCIIIMTNKKENLYNKRYAVSWYNIVRKGGMRMRFLWCTIYVRDIDASIRFYNEIVGLPIARRFSEPGAELAFLGDDETKLEIICGKLEPHTGGGISIGFFVDNLEEKMAFIEERGISIHSGPFTPSKRTRFFFVSDPDGVLVQFVEQKQR